MSVRVVAVLGIVAAAVLISTIDRTTTPASAQRRPQRAEDPDAKLRKPPVAKDDAEKKIYDVLTAIKADRKLQYRNVSADDGRLMRQITEAAGAKVVVEIGTSTGYSGLWLAMALRGTGGKLITYDISEERLAVANKHFKQAGVDDLITTVHGNAHEKVKELKEPIDVLFLDADKAGYIDYLQKLMPLIRPGGIIMAHNMVYPNPDPKFIEEITTNPKLDTSFLLMHGAGLSMTIKKR